MISSMSGLKELMKLILIKEDKTMSIETLRKEIYYYTGKKPSDEEVEEIKDFYEQSPHSDLSEIISDYYYSC